MTAHILHCRWEKWDRDLVFIRSNDDKLDSKKRLKSIFILQTNIQTFGIYLTATKHIFRLELITSKNQERKYAFFPEIEYLQFLRLRRVERHPWMVIQCFCIQPIYKVLITTFNVANIFKKFIIGGGFANNFISGRSILIALEAVSYNVSFYLFKIIQNAFNFVNIIICWVYLF